MPTYAVNAFQLSGYGLTPGRRRGYVLAAPVVQHVLALEQLGWTYERISTRAGLATCSVRQMLRQGNELVMTRRAVAIMQVPLAEFKWKSETHGELACYHAGCRCDLCRYTNIQHMKEWRRQRNRRTRMVDAEPSRVALQDAIDTDLTTFMEISRAIGGSRRTVSLLLAGRYSKIRQPTAQRIRRHLFVCRQRSEQTVPDLCLLCGWPLAEHRPYYQHIESRRVVKPRREFITTCRYGHRLTNENTYVHHGREECRECAYEAIRESNGRKGRGRKLL